MLTVSISMFVLFARVQLSSLFQKANRCGFKYTFHLLCIMFDSHFPLDVTTNKSLFFFFLMMINCSIIAKLLLLGKWFEFSSLPPYSSQENDTSYQKMF